GGSQQISLVIYPSITAAGTVQTLNLALSFNDAYGNRKSTNQLVGLQILPLSPQSGLSVSPLSPPPTSSRPPSSPSTPPSSPSSALQSNSPNLSPVTSGGNGGLTKFTSLVRSYPTVDNGNASNANNNNKKIDLNGKVDPPSLSANLSPPTS